MIIVVLCGGAGTRLEGYSFPKPLNMIYGKPSVSYCLQNLPDEVKTIHFVVAPHLIKYNFTETVTNEFKQKNCIFHYLSYFTRGAIESALLGTLDISEIDENIVFLDNDVLYTFPDNMFKEKNNAFIGYSFDKTTGDKYSYVKLDENNHIIDFKEKKRISDLFCCGVYGFQNIIQFRDLAFKRLNNITNTELYMSILFQDMIENKIQIDGIFFNSDIYHIGSLKELKLSLKVIKIPKMRICFDLDNTLVTYPTVPNDYSTVKPIDNMIQLLKQMSKEGHTIIIHTARRMKTHAHNIGSVIKDIGMVTFKTLEEFGIPYDEIIFGKPIADIYIDDRSVNPYMANINTLGYILEEPNETPLNSLKPNKYNTLSVLGNKVIKEGPSQSIKGEIYFYETLLKNIAISDYFPKYYESYIDGDKAKLTIEHIYGIPAFTLYKSNLLTVDHINLFLEFLDVLHTYKYNTEKVSKTEVISNYIYKLERRFINTEDYPFEDAKDIQDICLLKLKTYIEKDNIQIVDYIHGDFWFSNIIMDFKGFMKAFDMRGKVYNTYTTGGDRIYDYAKLYQSLLGYDCILNNVSMPYNSATLCSYFETEIYKHNITIDDLKIVTFSLVIGSLHAIENIKTKTAIWEWIKLTFL